MVLALLQFANVSNDFGGLAFGDRGYGGHGSNWPVGCAYVFSGGKVERATPEMALFAHPMDQWSSLVRTSCVVAVTSHAIVVEYSLSELSRLGQLRGNNVHLTILCKINNLQTFVCF